MLLIGRLFIGFGIGVVSMSVNVYLSECSPEKIRGAIVTTNVLFITFGQLFAYFTCLVSIPLGVE